MFFSVLLSPHRKLYLGFLTGPNWGRGSRLAGERAPHSVHIPLGRESLEWSSGIQAAGDWTGHKVFIFCGFAQASADRVFIESGPQTSRIRPCLATQREISVLRKNSCPLLPSPAFPLFHSPLLQHFTPEHRKHKSQGVERHGTPSCASTASQVFIWAKGDTLVGGVEGPMSPLWAPPCTLPYLFPSSQESVVFLLPIYYDCICAATTTAPHGGKGYKALPAPLFLPWNCTR